MIKRKFDEIDKNEVNYENDENEKMMKNEVSTLQDFIFQLFINFLIYLLSKPRFFTRFWQIRAEHRVQFISVHRSTC